MHNGQTQPLAASQPAPNGAAAIGVSITNERGEHRHYHARAVSFRIQRGVMQVVGREHGCYLWFDRCNLEVRDGRREILFRLLAGSASSDGTDLTIVAEVAPSAVHRTPRAKILTHRPKPHNGKTPPRKGA